LCSWEWCHPPPLGPGESQDIPDRWTHRSLGNVNPVTASSSTKSPSHRVPSFLRPSSVPRAEPESGDHTERRRRRCHHELSLPSAGLAGTGGQGEGGPWSHGPFRGCHMQHLKLLPLSHRLPWSGSL